MAASETSGSGVTPEFDSIQEADQAYFGDGQTDTDGDGSPDQQGWGEPEDVPVDWEGGWSLVRQARIEDPDTTRFFVIRATGDAGQALTEGGTVETADLSGSIEEIPHFSTRQDAEQAYQKWLNSQGSGDGDGSGDGGTPGEGGNPANWTEWAKVTEVPPWWVWGREHKSAEKMQMLAAGTLSDGTAVYLQPDGTVGDSAHIYTSPDALQSALDAYASNVENGNIPPDRQPTGNSPGRETVRQAGNAAAGTTTGPGMSGAGGGLVGTLTSPTGLVAVLVVAGVLYYAYQNGYLDSLTGDTAQPAGGEFRG